MRGAVLERFDRLTRLRLVFFVFLLPLLSEIAVDSATFAMAIVEGWRVMMIEDIGELLSYFRHYTVIYFYFFVDGVFSIL